MAAAAVWIALPIVVIVTQRICGRIFADFKVPLPTLTQTLLIRSAPLWFAGPAILVVLALLSADKGRGRTIFARLAFWAGILLGLAVLAAFLLPLHWLWHRLT